MDAASKALAEAPPNDDRTWAARADSSGIAITTLYNRWRGRPSIQKKAEGQFADGQFTGDWVWWRENGELLQKGAFVNGQQHGYWQRWHDTPSTKCSCAISSLLKGRLHARHSE